MTTFDISTIIFSLIDFEQSSISIKQGQLVHVFKKWGPEYKIEFDITVKKVPSNYANIVQFTIGGKQGQYGDRIPGVWLEPSIRRVYVSSGVNGLINHEFRFEYSLNQQVHIVVKQFKDAGEKYKYEIEVNDSTFHNQQNLDRFRLLSCILVLNELITRTYFANKAAKPPHPKTVMDVLMEFF